MLHYGYDNLPRLISLTQDIGGGAHDLTLGFRYNPAAQIASNMRSNDASAWTGPARARRGNSGNTMLNWRGVPALLARGMARLARIVIPDLPHHVMQRGNRRQEMFFSDDDYGAYRELGEGLGVCRHLR